MMTQLQGNCSRWSFLQTSVFSWIFDTTICILPNSANLLWNSPIYDNGCIHGRKWFHAV